MSTSDDHHVNSGSIVDKLENFRSLLRVEIESESAASASDKKILTVLQTLLKQVDSAILKSNKIHAAAAEADIPATKKRKRNTSDNVSNDNNDVVSVSGSDNIMPTTKKPKNNSYATKDRLTYEKRLWDAGYVRVAGIDEVGRGCLAGPVCVAGVILKPGTTASDFPKVRDSKLLNEEQRKSLCEQILRSDALLDHRIELGSVQEIDEHNILHCTLRHMANIAYDMDADHILVDGNQLPTMKHYDPAKQKDIAKYKRIMTSEGSHTSIVKGDDASLSIAAASIIAKVYRDNLMERMVTDNPGKYDVYFWQDNHGYPSVEHRYALSCVGPCEHHRTTYKWKAPDPSQVESLGCDKKQKIDDIAAASAIVLSQQK